MAVLYKNDSSHSVRPIVNARRSGGATLQSGSERKAEDSSHPRAVVNYQRSARHRSDSKPGAVAHE